jgi:hypothetical protein
MMVSDDEPEIDEYAELDYGEEDNYEPPEQLRITVNITKVTFLIPKKMGVQIQHLITDFYKEGIPSYCKKVGVQHPNYYSCIKGDRPCTLEFLNKLLSGIGYQACLSSQELLIQVLTTGQVVPNVDYVSPVIESRSYESINLLEQDITISLSSSSEKHQENSKTELDIPLLESPEESSKRSSDLLDSIFPTSSPTQLDVDL